jgi:HD superfamily phosphohydrolase
MGTGIHCPLYGTIEIDSLASMFIDTPEFQRLHLIRQTGTCYRVFPSATHSRFLHSLGTYELCRRVLGYLTHNLSGREVQILQIAALLHDIGHGPYSHVFEKVVRLRVDPTWSHEQQTARLIRQMVERHRIPVSQLEVTLICEYIDPPPSSIHKWTHQLIANKLHGIDVDKLDYLHRDVATMGLSAMSINTDRILRGMRIHCGQIQFVPSIAADIADVFSSRFRMYRRIYQHHTVVLCDTLLERIILGIPDLNTYLTNMDRFVGLVDDVVCDRSHDRTAVERWNRRSIQSREQTASQLSISASIAGKGITTNNALQSVCFIDGTRLSDHETPQIQALYGLHDTDWFIDTPLIRNTTL